MIDSLYKKISHSSYESEFSNLIHDTFSEEEINLISQYYNFKKGINCFIYHERLVCGSTSDGFNPSKEYGLNICTVKFEDEWFGLFILDYKFHNTEIDSTDDNNRYKYYKCDTFEGLLQALDKIKKDQISLK